MPSDILLRMDKLDVDALIGPIRPSLISDDPNEQYFFLGCLARIDPALWAGTSPERPLVLEGWEVERIMQLLTSPDPAIRVKVRLHALHPSSALMYISRQCMFSPRQTCL